MVASAVHIPINKTPLKQIFFVTNRTRAVHVWMEKLEFLGQTRRVIG